MYTREIKAPSHVSALVEGRCTSPIPASASEPSSYPPPPTRGNLEIFLHIHISLCSGTNASLAFSLSFEPSARPGYHYRPVSLASSTPSSLPPEASDLQLLPGLNPASLSLFPRELPDLFLPGLDSPLIATILIVLRTFARVPRPPTRLPLVTTPCGTSIPRTTSRFTLLTFRSHPGASVDAAATAGSS